MTATPWRLNGQGFDDIFTEMVLGPSPRELIDAGNLSRYRLWRPTTVNRSAMHHVAGELVASATVVALHIGLYTYKFVVPK